MDIPKKIITEGIKETNNDQATVETDSKIYEFLDKNLEKKIGLRHLVPPEFTSVVVTAPSGEIFISATRRADGRSCRPRRLSSAVRRR